MTNLNFTLTDNIRKYIDLLVNKKQLDKYKSYLSQPSIPYSVLKEISNELHNDNIYLQDIIKGSLIYIPPKPVEPINVEKEAKKQYLLKLHAENEYSKMVSNVNTSKIKDQMELTSYGSQASIVFNMLATFATLVAGGIYLGGKMYGSQLLGLAFGLVCGAFGVGVEVWLFFLKASSTQLEKDKEVVKQGRKDKYEINKRIRNIKKQQEMMITN
ncbi:hypothetical protein DLAC_00253 [Tieghemostelium lacteum]|uniref:Transmembrane protein n=1 Tax=Tieghemostelium lacteum TaxID=361077 RepID=A0A152A989_TIELA|nr:hypothetical protein DLAC_00253 [Tieghemostelium lacteum]|eukprot:KYR02789.1 hypothetical protein DLAC_00253 [Tieghemostelium lacteum]